MTSYVSVEEARIILEGLANAASLKRMAADVPLGLIEPPKDDEDEEFAPSQTERA